jgi:glucokinase
MILAGDVGGTKVHLELYNFANGRLQPVRDQKFPAHEFASLDDVVNKFLAGGGEKKDQIVAACFGCPGPVRDGRLKLTNLPWTLDERDLETSLGIPHIFLINDLEANGYGIPELAPESIFTLHPGDPDASGHAGLIAAGTGLGEALLIWDGNDHRPIPSEGGHCDFAARSNREIALLEYLRDTLKGRVSWERVVSGLGIKNIYAFLRDVEKIHEPGWLHDRMLAEDPNAVIGQCAEDGSSSLCFETMKVFCGAYGAEAGNIARQGTIVATAGVDSCSRYPRRHLRAAGSGGLCRGAGLRALRPLRTRCVDRGLIALRCATLQKILMRFLPGRQERRLPELICRTARTWSK